MVICWEDSLLLEYNSAATGINKHCLPVRVYVQMWNECDVLTTSDHNDSEAVEMHDKRWQLSKTPPRLNLMETMLQRHGVSLTSIDLAPLADHGPHMRHPSESFATACSGTQ